MDAQTITRRVLVVMLLAGFGATAGRAQVPTNNLTLWLDATSLSYLSDGANVSVWSNKSTFVPHNMNQGTTGFQPTFQTGVVLGNPAVRFDGIDDYLQSGSQMLSNFITAAEYTMFSVFNTVAISTTNLTQPWRNDGIVTDSSGFIGQLLQGTNVIAYNWDGNADQVGVPVTTGKWTLAYSRHSGGSLFLRTNNGSDQQSTLSGSTTSLTPWTLRVGSGNTANNAFLDGDVAEVLIYNAVLSPSDESTVQEYLFAKYGVPEPSVVTLLVATAFLLLRRRHSR